MDLIDFKTFNDHCLGTTCLIKLKLTGSIERVNKNLYINFQDFLHF